MNLDHRPFTATFPDPAERSAAEWYQVITAKAAAGAPGALAVCAEAIAAHPAEPRLRRARIKLLYACGRQAEAEADLRRVVELDPGHVKSRLRLSEFYEARGKHEKAMTLLAAGVKHDRSDVALRLCHAGLLLRLGDFEAAAAAYAAALQRDPACGARPSYELALRRLTADGAAGVRPAAKRLCLKGAESLRRGDAPAAKARFEQALHDDPAYANAWLGLRGANLLLGPAADAPAARKGPGMARTLRHRTLSPRGLLFDPAVDYRVRSRDEALERVETAEALRSRDNVYWTVDPGGERLEFPLPGDRPGGASQASISFLTSDSFILSLRAPMLVARGAVITDRDEIIHEVSFLHTPAHKYRARMKRGALRFDAALLHDGVASVRVFDQPAFLMCGAVDRGFGDWIINFPPRLMAYRAAGLDCAIVLSEDVPPKFIDMLLAMGVPRESLLFHDPDGVSVFPRLFVPSWPLPERRRPIRGWMDVFKPLKGSAPSPARRLYVSRRNIGHRVLVNEDQVIELFRAKGFHIVRPETLSLDQTLEVFGPAACVAGPYGSGLRNVLFCAPSPLALVLMPPYPEAFVEGTALWMSQSGARFHSVTGEAAPGGHPDPDPNEHPWIIDLAQVAQAIDETLAKLEPT